jgi:hypothetical protein
MEHFYTGTHLRNFYNLTDVQKNPIIYGSLFDSKSHKCAGIR